MLTYWVNGRCYPVEQVLGVTTVCAVPGRELPAPGGTFVDEHERPVSVTLFVLAKEHALPHVGMPATITINGDSYPATVVAVSKGGRCVSLMCLDVRGTGVFVETNRERNATRDSKGRYHIGSALVSFGERRFHYVREF